MGKDEKVRQTDDGQTLEFVSAVVNSLPRNLTPEQKKFWISRQGRKGLLTKRLREALGDTESKLDIQLEEIVRFYQEVFGLTVDATQVVLPPERQRFGWLLLVPAEMTLNRAWAKCQERFKEYWSYYGDDLDQAVPINERDPAKIGAYAVRFRDRVEADEEWKNTSANQIASKEITTITLLERLSLGLWYHWKTGGKHLDIHNWTLCAGSRDSYGNVPHVSLDAGGEFRVGCFHPGFGCGGGLRPREAAAS
ncbi:MAG: hypothetical protein PHD51_04080 [Patescibacteria group bacterium]|nr:hypothetical protein [Patescibacteria group bacterium]MDD5490804.1 hypothetical protein [Patescibacteria group bacterium]